MGTRCLTVFVDQYGSEIAVLYRQFDGYPEGHGRELSAFLATRQMCNGIGGDRPPGKVWANGVDCLAAQVVAHFKNGNMEGNFYLHPAGTRDIGEAYVYFVSATTDTGPIVMRVTTGSGGTIYDGEPSGYENWLKKRDRA